MSKIEVRAWDEETKTMILHPYVCCTGGIGQKLEYTPCPQALLELYSTIEDKNGVGICEGDIVKEESTDDTTYIGQIIFESASFWFNYEEDHYKSLAVLHLKRLKKMEVIGNIHQHPELLK